jgi:hypothetical protein
MALIKYLNYIPFIHRIVEAFNTIEISWIANDNLKIMSFIFFPLC